VSPTAPGQGHERTVDLDGGSGFSVLETDSAENLLHDLSIWSPYIDFQVCPVVDVMEASAMQQQAIELRKSVD
jgi:hypothetical protein